MFRLYSKGCEYALRALAYVIEREGVHRFPAKEVCEKAGIPESFTRKIFQSLVQGGFLEAVRGPGGGYSLSVDARKVSVLRFIQAVDGKETFDSCVMGLEHCGGENPCPMHEAWARVKTELLEQLESMTVEDLVAASLAREDAQGQNEDPT